VSEFATSNFTYSISDGNGGTSTVISHITVNGSNDNPTANNVSQSVLDTAAINAGNVVATGNLITASVAAHPDGDSPLAVSSIQGVADGSPITVTAGGVIAHGTYGTLTISTSGTYSYTANSALDALQIGTNPTDVFTFVVADSQSGLSIPHTLSFNITGADDSPTGINFILDST